MSRHGPGKGALQPLPGFATVLTMTHLQRLVLLLSGSRAAEIERESRSWLVTCSSCGAEHSYWDLGGIRYRASSVGKKIRISCPSCGARSSAAVSRDVT